MDLDDLQAIAARERAARKPVQIRCCTAAGCLSSGSAKVAEGLEAALAQAGLVERAEVREVGCLLLCCEGPLVQVDPEGPLYERVLPEQAASIVQALDGGPEAQARRGDPRRPFFARQTSIVLENSGRIEPDQIESYIEAGGYEALYQVLRELSPAEVVEEITRSGLRGRGGAGYPTGLQWAPGAQQPTGREVVACHAPAGDPGPP